MKLCMQQDMIYLKPAVNRQRLFPRGKPEELAEPHDVTTKSERQANFYKHNEAPRPQQYPFTRWAWSCVQCGCAFTLTITSPYLVILPGPHSQHPQTCITTTSQTQYTLQLLRQVWKRHDTLFISTKQYIQSHIHTRTCATPLRCTLNIKRTTSCVIIYDARVHAAYKHLQVNNCILQTCARTSMNIHTYCSSSPLPT